LRIKICGNKTLVDVKMAVMAGADAVGFLVGQLHASKDFILPSTALRLASSLPPYISPVIVTHLMEAESILEIILKTGINTVQLHGTVSVDDVKMLRDKMPLNSKIIISSYVKSKRALPVEDYYPFIDAVLLDCYNDGPNDIFDGANKKKSGAFEWEYGAEFVERCPLPVILAGGLSYENAADAISQVNPFGIDANRRLNSNDGESRSFEKCKDFVRVARTASTSTMPAHFE
jgi:phosphoribosylanthranilate isomerase